MSSGLHGSVDDARPRRNFTRLEYDKMIDAGILGEDERVELVGGTILATSPEGSEHAGTIELCADVLRRAFGGGFTVRVQHPIVIDPDGEPQPDLAVVAGGPRAHLGAHPRTAALIVEVAASSLAYDRGAKSRLYAGAGLPEYWIVNLIDRLVEVHREPSARGYRRVEILASGMIVPVGAPAAPVEISSLLP
jgi:Uma2 family endonuclease